jgi:hypothetical protein
MLIDAGALCKPYGLPGISQGRAMARQSTLPQKEVSMANRRLFQFRYSYERDLTDLFAVITIAGSGVPTLAQGKGIASVTRNSAGDYTIALRDNFNLLMGMDSFVKNATGVPTSIIGLKTDSVSSSTAPLVRIVCSVAGTPTDPVSGDTLYISLICRNAST